MKRTSGPRATATVATAITRSATTSRLGGRRERQSATAPAAARTGSMRPGNRLLEYVVRKGAVTSPQTWFQELVARNDSRAAEKTIVSSGPRT